MPLRHRPRPALRSLRLCVNSFFLPSQQRMGRDLNAVTGATFTLRPRRRRRPCDVWRRADRSARHRQQPHQRCDRDLSALQCAGARTRRPAEAEAVVALRDMVKPGLHCAALARKRESATRVTPASRPKPTRARIKPDRSSSCGRRDDPSRRVSHRRCVSAGTSAPGSGCD
jgi:hypothetical protein